ncbi:hypothetical protein GO491_07630 [Flavobacteriaceae bacterium Ap0902]|nr:hypothetical protein [Flavobacteriaceae bacterium Ap0902]
MNRLTILLLFICTIGFSQEKGKVFSSTPKTPTEQTERNGVIVVTKNMYGLTFEDNAIPEAYKKAVKTFFKQRLNGYTDLKRYRLNIAKKYGYIYVEDKKMQALE